MMTVLPVKDLVHILLETPFSNFDFEAKRHLFRSEIPQPILACHKPQRSFNKKGKPHNRNFQKSWYEIFSWLCGSVDVNRLFCWPCLFVSTRKSVWNKQGFEDFSNATRSFHVHDDSAEHLKNVLKFKKMKKRILEQPITAGLQDNNDRLCKFKFNEKVRLNRRVMQLPIDAALFLSNQELPFQEQRRLPSNPTSRGGNFKELLQLLLARSPLELQQHHATNIDDLFAFDSERVQNELVECVAQYVQERVHADIKDAPFFALRVDDATELLRKARQSCVSVRYVTADGRLRDSFLGFFDGELGSVLTSLLEPFDFKSKLISQSYDGAVGEPVDLLELEAKIKTDAPQALHCLGHPLNAVLEQSFRNTTPACRVFFSTVAAIGNFFHDSAKRKSVAQSVIGKVVPTGGETRTQLLDLIVEEWDGLKSVFELLMSDPDSDYETVRQCKSFLNELGDFEFCFLAHLLSDVLNVTEFLFGLLQKRPLDIVHCLEEIADTCATVEAKRNKETCRSFFDAALKKTSRKIGGDATEERGFEPMKVLSYEIIDGVLREMKTRVRDVENLAFVALADASKFEEYSQKLQIGLLHSLKACYPGNPPFNAHRLKNELEIIYADPQYRNKSLADVIGLLIKNDMADTLKEAYRLFCLVLTIPSMTALGERSFTRLKRMKSYLGSCPSQKTMSALATLALERKLVQELMVKQPFYEDVLDKFAALEKRGIDLIFKE